MTMKIKNYVIAINHKHLASYIPEKNFTELFTTNNNWKQIEQNKYNNEPISFLYNSRVVKFYDINTDICNIFTDSHFKYLTNKSNLFHTINKYLPETYKKYMMYHTDVDINNLDNYEHLFKNNKIFILRPTWGFARQGIQLFNNFSEFKSFMISKGKYELNIQNNKNNKNNKNIYVLSEYLQNQLLINRSE